MSGEAIGIICSVLGTGVTVMVALGTIVVRYGRRQGNMEAAIGDLRADVQNNLGERRRIWERLQVHDRRLTVCETLIERAA
jgi:hypothetical protein